jgi:8-oxo-dGTP diphosphatase
MPVPNEEIRVVCAVIIDRHGCFLAARRAEGMALAGKWEFPGGKIDGDELPATALRREIHEETGALIRVLAPLEEVVHDYETVRVRLLAYYAEVESGEPVALEHEELVWVAVEDLQALDWAAADLPLVRTLLARHGPSPDPA